MNVDKILIWENDTNVYIEKYIIKNSKEFQFNQKRPVVIICPGGGYISTSDREAEPIALKFLAKGYQAIVLRYSTYYGTELPLDIQNKPKGNDNSIFPKPLFDLAKTMLLVHEKNEDWFIDTNNIVICGFSAGAHLCASLATMWKSDLLMKKFNTSPELFKPSQVILGYGIYDFSMNNRVFQRNTDIRMKIFLDLFNQSIFGNESPSEEQFKFASPLHKISIETPPCFLWHTANDNVALVENSLKFSLELTKHSVPYELHIFENGPHGLSASDRTSSSNEFDCIDSISKWMDLCFIWLNKNFVK